MKTNKLPMIQMLVATGDQILPSGNFIGSSTALNLQNGQLAVMSYDSNSVVRTVGTYLQAGDDSNEVAAIKIVQGTPLSSNVQLAQPWEVSDKAFMETGIIRKNKINSVYVKKAKFATFGAQSVTTFPTPVNNGIYSAYLSLDSVRMEKEFGLTNTNSIYASSPVVADYTGITSPLDYVLTNLMTEFNSHSKAVTSNTRRGNQSFVVFGVKVGGGSGQALGTITPTTNITFQTTDGIAQVLTSSVELCQSLARLVQDSTLTNTSTIENVDITAAGAAAKIDALIVIGLPHSLAAYYDNVEQRMVTPSINLAGNFISGVSDPVVTRCNAEEGTGHTSKWKLWADKRYQLNVHTKQNTPHGDWFSEGISYIDLAKQFYTSYIIEYFDTEKTITGTIESPKKAVLLFRCEPLSSFTVTVANIVTRIAAGNTPVPFSTSNDAGTGTASSVVVAAVEALLTVWLEHARTTGEGFAVGGDAVAAGTYLS